MIADSREVARVFEERHDNVLRDIRELIAKEPSLAPSKFGAIKIKDLTGESTSHVEMTRDGFSRLVMPFTGDKAAVWIDGRRVIRITAREGAIPYHEAVQTGEGMRLRDRNGPKQILSCFGPSHSRSLRSR